MNPDFEIKSSEELSSKFRQLGMHSFSEAATMIRQLRYGRNKFKEHLLSLFDDHCGTCSTKHALLKSLANENGFQDLRLMIGLFKMNGRNTPKVAERLLQYGLEYIPEAHCYLKYNGFILDYTKAHSKPSDFVHDLIMETEIEPDQITRFKVDYHRQYLMEWLQMNKGLPFSIDEIWAIREACIGDLSK